MLKLCERDSFWKKELEKKAAREDRLKRKAAEAEALARTGARPAR